MALKPDMKVLDDDITWSCESAADAGSVLCMKTAGSGVGVGDRSGQADLISNPSGYVPVGILMFPVVSLDETRFHRNFQNMQTLVSEKCWLIRKGRVTTDKVTGTPTKGQTAYLSSSGVFTPTVHATGGTVATPKVGQFMSTKDENGWICVEFSLPVI